MNMWLKIIFITLSLSGCVISEQAGKFSDSSIQTVEMGKLTGLRIIEIASVYYPDPSTLAQSGFEFSDVDKEHFGDSLIQSFKRSDVRVLPSAQTKVHIDFTKLLWNDDLKQELLIMSADVVVSRNGIMTRKTVKISYLPKFTIAATKNHGVKLFIQELGNLSREQSSFKR